MRTTIITIIIIITSFLIVSCSKEESEILKYKDFIKGDTKEFYYNDIVAKLGHPNIIKEHLEDITASWSRTFRKANETIGGEKIIASFDKNTKKMIEWQYRTW